MKKTMERGQICYLIIGLVLIFEILNLFYNSGIIAGWNERADKFKVYAKASRDDKTILAGDIYDKNGELLAETKFETITYYEPETYYEIEILENGEEKKVEKTRDILKEKEIIKTSYTNVMAYSQLLGYTGKRNLDLSADTMEEIVGDRNDYRLMAFLDEDLGEEYWGENNGLYAISDIDCGKGQSATLTIDNKIQTKTYEALAKQINESTEQGSAVVLDAKTGEILSMVAFPAYDFNELSDAKMKMITDEKETDLEPGYPVSYKNAKTPGSIFKILTEVSLIDHGLEDFKVEDMPFQVNGWQCNNAYSSVGDKIGYKLALERSSNVFFAQAALELGKENLKETAEKFMLTEDSNYISLDFGHVPYNWDLNVSEDVFAQTGFGQGKTELTTVHAAMIVQAIANDGVMMKPYLIDKLTDAEGKVVYTGTAEELSKATSKSTADKVTESMRLAAKYASSHYKGLGNTAAIFEKYQVAGKTGTAENGDKNDTVNAWFVSFAPADNPQYVVVVNQCKTNKGGYKMTETAAEIYQYLFEGLEQ